MKTWQRRSLIGMGGVAGLFVIVLGGVYGMSASAVGTRHAVSPHPFDASAGEAAAGERLVTLYGCTECHGPDLGGTTFIDGMPFARVPAPNLTAGAPGGAFTDEEFETAVRHGIGRDGRKLFVMPSQDYTYLSDDDVADILAYVRTLPAVQRELPGRQFGPVGRMLTAMGKVTFQPDLIAADPEARHLDRPDANDPLEMGYYLTRLCIGCHGNDLAGAPPMDPESPAGPNLTPAGNLSGWSFDQFRELFATGRRPDGTEVSPAMPWQIIGQARPHELEAIWSYLRSIEPIEPAPAR
jgi:mono/diheme cytochrome c family protein